MSNGSFQDKFILHPYIRMPVHLWNWQWVTKWIRYWYILF